MVRALRDLEPEIDIKTSVDPGDVFRSNHPIARAE
jgi:hypothetical protein